MKKLCLLMILLFGCTGTLFAGRNVLFFNNIARPMGMGGAFAAVQDSLQAHFYNPAAAEFLAREGSEFNISFDLIRGIYTFVMMLDAVDYDAAVDDEDVLYGIAFASLLLSTANISWTGDRWFFKINFMDQLITQGPDFPMYSSSVTLGHKFKGPLTGFQTGVTGHLYNVGSPSLPQGYSVTWGLFYRAGDSSPLSLGLFYFHSSDDMPFIRKPFEQIMNNTFNIGAAYALPGRFTLSADLRNINNFSLEAYYQPHFGLEKLFFIGKDGESPMTLALRVGTYYDSETGEIGYSGGFDFRMYFGKNTFSGPMRGMQDPGFCYFSYTITKEENVPSYNRILRYNHIFSFGVSF